MSKDRPQHSSEMCVMPAHPANFRGCEVYKQILERKTKKDLHLKTRGNLKSDSPKKTILQNNLPEVEKTRINKQMKYSDVLKSNNTINEIDSHTNQSPNNTLEQILLKQAEKFDLILQTLIVHCAQNLQSSPLMDFQLALPLKIVTPEEVYRNIKSMDTKKAPGFDLIDKKVLQELPRKAIAYLTMLFNAILRIRHFPDVWKVSRIVMIHKPDDIALLSSSKNPNQASHNLQRSLNGIEIWLAKWRIAASVTKSVHVTFTLSKGDCPPVTLNGTQLPHQDSVKYLGMHLDRRLTWKKHIWDEINHEQKSQLAPR
ncbi:unnamed protein product [Leptosia nina]|uniref:Reverse transcriptase n=1 Tax=Leptosia nina TaxID=320188 RepID=A0AAV1JP34_9NEOP